MPWKLFVHLLVLVVNIYPEGSVVGTHVDKRCSLLKMTYGGIDVPEVEMYSMTVTHSCRPGCAVYALFNSVTTTLTPLHDPIEQPKLSPFPVSICFITVVNILDLDILLTYNLSEFLIELQYLLTIYILHSCSFNRP